jgi:hypothetical protein
LARAAALEDAAELARRSGNCTAAVTLLHQALDEYTEAGAGRAVARLERNMRALPTAPGPGVGDLSEAELRVASLVARGYKNR